MAEKMGLKDRKKKKRKKRIIAAATKLFKSKGYEETTIIDIAEKADVGTGTIYNYFSSKNDILLHIVMEIFIEKKPEAVIYEDDPLKTLIDYLDSYFDEFTEFDKEIWRGWFAALFKEPNLFAKAYQLDLKIVGELAGICEQMQDQKLITADVPAGEIAMAVYSPFISWMMSYIMLPEMDKQAAMQEFKRQVNLLYRGIRPNSIQVKGA
jgi:AcrR family transcriptional regulator